MCRRARARVCVWHARRLSAQRFTPGTCAKWAGFTGGCQRWFTGAPLSIIVPIMRWKTCACFEVWLRPLLDKVERTATAAAAAAPAGREPLSNKLHQSVHAVHWLAPRAGAQAEHTRRLFYRWRLAIRISRCGRYCCYREMRLADCCCASKRR